MFTHAAFVLSNATALTVANTYLHHKPGYRVSQINCLRQLYPFPGLPSQKSAGLFTYTNQRRKTAPAMRYLQHNPTLRIVSGFLNYFLSQAMKHEKNKNSGTGTLYFRRLVLPFNHAAICMQP